MKQKEISIDPSLSFETQNMVQMYFAVRAVNGIEGFIHSEEEFLKKYKNSYMINDLRSSKYYSVYLSQCKNCFQKHETLIRSRTEFYNYLNQEVNTCIGCSIFHSTTESMLGQKLK